MNQTSLPRAQGPTWTSPHLRPGVSFGACPGFVWDEMVTVKGDELGRPGSASHRLLDQAEAVPALRSIGVERRVTVLALGLYRRGWDRQKRALVQSDNCLSRGRGSETVRRYGLFGRGSLARMRVLHRGCNGAAGFGQNNVGDALAGFDLADPAKGDKAAVSQAAQGSGKGDTARTGFPARCADR